MNNPVHCDAALGAWGEGRCRGTPGARGPAAGASPSSLSRGLVEKGARSSLEA